VKAHLPFETKRSLAELAPASLRVPGGWSTSLDYEEDGSVSAAVKLQELCGRYPKHPWLEDPWSARPAHRTR
jgi:hypothetical protein